MIAIRYDIAGLFGKPGSWTKVAWKSTSSSKSRARERIWFSPHCLQAVTQRDLFAGSQELSP